MRHKVLALDLSLSCPGYAILGLDSRGLPVLIEKGHMKTTVKKGNGGRLEEVAGMLQEIFTQHPDVETVVRERGFSRFPAVTQALFRVVGVSDLYAWRNGFPKVEEIPPTTVKKALTGKGKASKEDVESAVRRVLNLPDGFMFGTDDESDAVAVGLAYYSGRNLLKKVG